MRALSTWVVAVVLLTCMRPDAAVAQTFDLAALLAAGKLTPVKREVGPLAGTPGAVQVAENSGPGVVWIAGSDFSTGTITVDVRGRDLDQRSFVGLAFHRHDDNTYEAVYVRPFNFRSKDIPRRQNAVQYIAVPEFDWPRLRKEFPSEFENPVDASIDPLGWVSLRLVVTDKTVQVYVGPGTTPTLEVRRLAARNSGLIGLFTGNASDGGFTNLRISR